MTLYDIMCQLTLQLYWTCMDPKRGFFFVCGCVFFFYWREEGGRKTQKKVSLGKKFDFQVPDL